MSDEDYTAEELGAATKFYLAENEAAAKAAEKAAAREADRRERERRRLRSPEQVKAERQRYLEEIDPDRHRGPAKDSKPTPLIDSIVSVATAIVGLAIVATLTGKTPPHPYPITEGEAAKRREWAKTANAADLTPQEMEERRREGRASVERYHREYKQQQRAEAATQPKAPHPYPQPHAISLREAIEEREAPNPAYERKMVGVGFWL